MDKTISISLGGYSFILDEGAYHDLKKYLDDIRKSLGKIEDVEEIISDIEIRIAELFKERLKGREVVNKDDVVYIIEIMGKPEQFVDEDNTGTEDVKTETHSLQSKEVKRKLYRDPNDKIIGGVFSGLAHYFNIEPWIMRGLGILLLIADIPFTRASSVVLVYIILMIILPKAKTASQKYEMYGESGDIHTIKHNVSKQRRKRRGGTSSLGETLGRLILVFISVVLIMMGVGFIFSAIGVVSMTYAAFPMNLFETYIIESVSQMWWTRILGLISFLIPGVLLIMTGLHILSDRFKINKTFVLSGIGVWIVAILGMGALTVNMANNFRNKASTTEANYYELSQDTIQISFESKRHDSFKLRSWWMKIDTDSWGVVDGRLQYEIDNDIEIRPSDNDELGVEIVYKSRGSSSQLAQKYADEIQYAYSISGGNEIMFDRYLTLDEDSKFRAQSVSIIVYVPEGKVVHSNNVGSLILSSENTKHKNYRKGKNKYYQLVDGKFVCLNCSKNEEVVVKNNSKGIRIQDGSDTVIINSDGIYVSDGEEVVDIEF